MFKRIAIHLTGPLCKCVVNHLGWSVKVDYQGKPSLNIFCAECGVEVFIPSKQFVASFELDAPYPKEKVKDEPKDKPKSNLGVIDGGKVISLNAGENEKKEE